jgi:branched-chain amino acid transport system permease protein
MLLHLAGALPLAGKLSLLPQSVVSGLVMGMTYALVAAGLALIWGVVDVVNFAHGEYMLIAMYVTLFATNRLGVDPLLVLPVNAVLLFVAGYLTYRTVIARVMDAPMLAQIFATFGLVLIIRYGALFLAGPYTESVDSFVLSGHTDVAGVVVSHPQAATAAVSVLTLATLFWFLRRTRTGKAIRATAQDWEAARVMGIDPDRVNAITWGVGIAAVGVAGTMVATFFPTQPELTPTTWTLIAFAAVALGGFGSVLGAVLGGVGISLVEHLGATLLNPSYKELYVFVVFIAALLLRGEDLLGRLTGGERP